MGTTILLLCAVGLGCYFLGRGTRSDGKSAVRKTADNDSHSRYDNYDRPDAQKNAAGLREPVPPSPAEQAQASALHRAIANREMTPERRRALSEIRQQQALDRQHDSRMAAAAGLMGVAAGAALMRHHDAEAMQAHIDQAAAMQRDAIEQQDHDDGGADGSDASDLADEFGIDGIDFDEDWSVDDESDHGDTDADSQNGYDDDSYGGDDSGYDDGGSDDADGQDDYGGYGDDYSDCGGDDGGGDFF